jgi:hypothetical protein
VKKKEKMKTRKNRNINIVAFAIALLSLLALVGSAQAAADLNVTRIDVNRDIAYLRIADDRCTGEMAFGPTNHVGYKTQCNNISADITEGNGVDTGTFNVSFEVDGTEICNITTANLNGTSRRVWCNCSWYPLVGNYTIEVTVDCNNTVTESDEANNTLSRNVTANVHGLKGNHWQDGRSISKMQCYEQDTINLVYSVGDSETLGGYNNLWGTSLDYTANWTANDVSIPAGATIKLARLYVYYNFDRTPAQNVTDYFNLTFNDIPASPAAIYTDRKNPSGFGASGSSTCPMNSYNFKYGELAYNVTNEFNASGNNASLNNSQPQTDNHVSMSGMLLVVVYEHPSEPKRTICINEGFDMLKSGNYYNRHVGVTPEEATTYANFSGENILLSDVKKANLTTITNHGWAKTGDSGIYFNDDLLGTIGNYAGDTEIGIREDDILSLLQENDNTVTFRSIDSGGKYGGHWFEATNAFLVVYYPYSELHNGWNFVSTPKRLAEGHNTASIVFNESLIDTDGHSIYKYNASTGSWEQMGVDGKVGPLTGIWIYSNGTAEAPLVYDTFPRRLPPTKMLYAGWNAIGLSDTVSASANEALTSVEAKWSYLIGFDSVNQTYETSIINDATSEAHSETRLMYPTKGYWIYMTADGELAGIS